MADHTIAENLIRLQDTRNSIVNAITEKGGVVPVGAGLEDIADTISSIPTGSGPVVGLTTLSLFGSPDGKSGETTILEEAT